MIVIINTNKHTVREIRNRKEKKQDRAGRWAQRMKIMTELLFSQAISPFFKTIDQKRFYIDEIANDAKRLVYNSPYNGTPVIFRDFSVFVEEDK